jgi:hypothetical protein
MFEISEKSNNHRSRLLPERFDRSANRLDAHRVQHLSRAVAPRKTPGRLIELLLD